MPGRQCRLAWWVTRLVVLRLILDLHAFPPEDVFLILLLSASLTIYLLNLRLNFGIVDLGLRLLRLWRGFGLLRRGVGSIPILALFGRRSLGLGGCGGVLTIAGTGGLSAPRSFSSERCFYLRGILLRSQFPELAETLGDGVLRDGDSVGAHVSGQVVVVDADVLLLQDAQKHLAVCSRCAGLAVLLAMSE